jgi:hypothetical protein
MLPASLLIPPVPVPVVLLPLPLLVVEPLVDPVVLPLAEGPPAPELPPVTLCATARGPARTSAAARTIIAAFMVSFPSLLQRRDKAWVSTTFL